MITITRTAKLTQPMTTTYFLELSGAGALDASMGFDSSKKWKKCFKAFALLHKNKSRTGNKNPLNAYLTSYPEY